ncbi:MAG TPA: glycosyl hydrolase family 28 protein [Edaphobacter sp.]|nr:glycosyl hydrolase family 28 protein [Edaphobacter sp.]
MGVAVLGMGSVEAFAQDSRTVTEPIIPPSCMVLQAQQMIVNGEPASETTLDTSRLQSALAGCASGQAVELSTSGTNNVFLIGPITLPAGVTLLVDGGVTVFGSRNPADYQVTTAGAETCGTVGTAGNGCLALITASAANAAIMGYGVIDGRGQDKLLVKGVVATYSWWDNAGTAQLTSGGAQNNPILVSANAANLILYKITFRNSPMFHVKWSGNLTNKTGFTAWGVKVITPFSTRNTDGIDPSGLNISILNSSISDGDDNVAVSASSPAQNITVSNVNTYSGHGISIGSITKGGLTNMLVENIVQMGTAIDKNGIGLRIKAQQSNGGLVQNVTYQNVCSANNKVAIYLSPYYSTSAGTSYPSLENIVYRNIHVITEGTVTLQGYQNTAGTVINPSTITLDNVIFDTLAQKDFSPAPQNLAITLGPGPVSSLLTTLTGTNITYTGSVTMPDEAPYPCSLSNFQYLVGELYASTGTATNLQTTSLNAPTSVTLNAMLQPAMSQVTYASISGGGTYTGTPAPTAAVQFLEGTTVVGTGTLGGNGTIASVTLAGVLPGVHTYTAQYPGDTTYTNPLTFGSVTVTVVGVPTTTAVAVSGGQVYGAPTAITATVTPTGTGTPTGTVQFLDGGVVLGTQPLQNGVATFTAAALQAGTNALTAVYQGDTTYATSTGAATPTVVAQATSVTSVTASAATNPGASTPLTVTVTGVSGALVPTGTVTVMDGTASVGAGPLVAGKATISVTLQSLGTHTLTAQYSGDPNYITSSGTISISVVVPFAVTATPTTVSLAAGGLSNTAVLVTPAGGFNGSATLTCSSPVSYVTCAVAPTTVTVSGGVAGKATVIITVSPSVGALGNGPLAPEKLKWLAMLLPLGMIGFARRGRTWGRVVFLMTMLAVVSAGAIGCNNGSSPKLPAAGTQVVTITGTGSGVVSTAQISVMVTN